MQPFMLHGSTVEEKLASAETAIRQMIRRLTPQKMHVEYANTGISGYTQLLDNDEHQLKTMIPVEGEVVNVRVFCESVQLVQGASKKETMLRFEIEIAPRLYESFSAVVGEGKSSTPGNKSVAAGARVIISSTIPITGFWYSLEIKPLAKTKVIDNPQLALSLETE